MHQEVPIKGDTARQGDYKQNPNALDLSKVRGYGPSFGRNKVSKRHEALVLESQGSKIAKRQFRQGESLAFLFKSSPSSFD
jgi:hypothetical protein